MDTNREKVKSILTCLDEEDYEQALRELVYLPAVITSISLFISGIVFLSRKQWNKAVKIFEGLSNKLNPNTSDEEYVLFCFIRSIRNIIHWKKRTESDVFELDEKRLQSLSLKNINMEDVKSTFLILKGIRAIKGTNSNEFSEVIEILNSPNLGLIEQPIINIKPTELFNKYYTEEHQVLFLLSLLSSEIIMRIVYLLYINAAYDVFKSANTEEQKRILQRIYDLIKRIEPRIDNSEHSVPIFYKMLKRAYNEWTFSWFISQSHIQEGFPWFESTDDGKGLDFLRLGALPNYSGSSLLEKVKSKDYVDSQNEDNFFIVVLEYHPYAYKLEDIVELSETFEAQLLKDRIDIKQKLLRYFSSFDFYCEYLKKHSDLDQHVKDEIFLRIEKNTDEIWTWGKDYPMYILQIYLPFELGKMWTERENYDEAIYVFNHSMGESEERKDAIKKCRYHRDGFIYGELKKVLKGLSEREQKQLIAYSKIFSLEFRLRNIVDKTISTVHNNNKWLEVETKPKLKGIKENCKQKQKDYDDNCYNRDVAQKNSLIDFTTLPELKTIIDEYWDLFKDKFKDKQQFFALLTQIIPIRIDIAHARLIDEIQLAVLSRICDQLDKVIGGESSEEQMINSKYDKW